MDIKSLITADGQQYREIQAIKLLENFLSRNGELSAGSAALNALNDIDSIQHLLKNVRDAKSFQKIMEKFKINASEHIIEDNFKDGQLDFLLMLGHS